MSIPYRLVYFSDSLTQDQQCSGSATCAATRETARNVLSLSASARLYVGHHSAAPSSPPVASLPPALYMLPALHLLPALRSTSPPAVSPPLWPTLHCQATRRRYRHPSAKDQLCVVGQPLPPGCIRPPPVASPRCCCGQSSLPPAHWVSNR